MLSNKIIEPSKNGPGWQKGYGSFRSAWRTLQGIETMSMIRQGRVRWVAKGDVVAEARFSPSSSLSLPNFLPHLHNSTVWVANFAMKPLIERRTKDHLFEPSL